MHTHTEHVVESSCFTIAAWIKVVKYAEGGEKEEEEETSAM